MRVMITGVTGLVGSALAAELASRGHRTIGLSRDAASAKRRVPSLEHAYAWPDVAQAPPPEALEADAIVHLAGEPVSGRWTAAKRRAIEESRVTSTRALAETIGKSERPRVLVSASAMGFYGSRGDDVLREDAAPGDDFLSGVCVAWEREAELASRARVVTLRTSLVLAREGGALAEMRRVFSLGLGGRMGSGAQWWSWIHLADLLGLIALALEDASLSGPLNAASPEPARQIDFAKALARVLHRPAFLPAPEFALRTALGGFADELLASRRLEPARALQAGYRFRFEALEPALRDLLVSD